MRTVAGVQMGDYGEQVLVTGLPVGEVVIHERACEGQGQPQQQQYGWEVYSESVHYFTLYQASSFGSLRSTSCTARGDQQRPTGRAEDQPRSSPRLDTPAVKGIEWRSRERGER